MILKPVANDDEQSRADGTPCSVIELRRYRLHPGKRENLISLFDSELVETQEATGMHVIGQFRDIDDPDAFVWLRGFADMDVRANALERFYGGPVWADHRSQANATMCNSDNVLLLKPRTASDALSSAVDRPASGETMASQSLFVCNICHLKPSGETAFSEFFEKHVRQKVIEAGADIVGTMVSNHAPNTWPRLPVREGETVFVWVARFADVGSYSTYVGRLAQDDNWRTSIFPSMDTFFWRPIEVARLSPTARSGLR